jgi:hypothetical protein
MLAVNIRADTRSSITPKPTLRMVPARLPWPSTDSTSSAKPRYVMYAAPIDTPIEAIRRDIDFPVFTFLVEFSLYKNKSIRIHEK